MKDLLSVPWWFVQSLKICTALNDLYSVELFVQRWIFLRCSVEWFALRWMICVTLNNSYDVEWFFTLLQILYDVDWFVQRWKLCTTWMIRCAMDDFYNVEWFGLQWIIEYRLFNEWCAYSRQYCNIFYANLWVDLFLIWKYQEEIYSALPQKLVIKRCFWSL